MGSSTTILIADDDRDLLDALGTRLRAAGYDVVAAADAYQAVHLAQERRPDLVVLDTQMPAGDGFSVQDRIHRHCVTTSTPLIYVSGGPSLHTRALARKHGAAAILDKPFEVEELLASIKETLSGRAAA